MFYKVNRIIACCTPEDKYLKQQRFSLPAFRNVIITFVKSCYLILKVYSSDFAGPANHLDLVRVGEGRKQIVDGGS